MEQYGRAETILVIPIVALVSAAATAFLYALSR